MELDEEFDIFIWSMWALYNLYIIFLAVNNDILIHHWGALIIMQIKGLQLFLDPPSDFIADCCVQARCKRHNIDWLAVEQSTLSSSEPGCNTQRLRRMIYWKPTDRRIRMTSHPCLRNPADAQDVSAFLHHLMKALRGKRAWQCIFSLQRIKYCNEIFQFWFLKNYL